MKVLNKNVVIFGAGKIGRSLIGQIFSRNGYTITFIDIDRDLVSSLNQRRAYTVVTLHDNSTKEEHVVESVSALHISEKQEIINAINQANICVTAAGANSLQHIAPYIATALKARSQEHIAPLDVILAENMRNAKETLLSYLLKEGLTKDFLPGIIATSISKIVPDVPAHERKDSALLTYCDSCNTLILSQRGWKNSPPAFPDLQLVKNIEAYINRKLLIHNLMHAALAYFGYRKMPRVSALGEIMGKNSIRTKIDKLIRSVSNALLQEYPQEFTKESLIEYYMDVLKRISNPLLRDTVYRVGKDIPRKLGKYERIVSALFLLDRHNEPTDIIIELYCAAVKFKGADSTGALFARDQQFHEKIAELGIEYALYQVSSFDVLDSMEKRLSLKIKKRYENL